MGGNLPDIVNSIRSRLWTLPGDTLVNNEEDPFLSSSFLASLPLFSPWLLSSLSRSLSLSLSLSLLSLSSLSLFLSSLLLFSLLLHLNFIFKKP